MRRTPSAAGWPHAAPAGAAAAYHLGIGGRYARCSTRCDEALPCRRRPGLFHPSHVFSIFEGGVREETGSDEEGGNGGKEERGAMMVMMA